MEGSPCRCRPAIVSTPPAHRTRRGRIGVGGGVHPRPAGPPRAAPEGEGTALRTETRTNFAVIATVPFVMVLSNSMIIPVLPAIQQALGRSLFQVGLLITAFSVAAGLVIPIGGYLSDRFGRKRVMVPSLIIFGAGGLVCALAPLLLRNGVYGVILAGRVLQGIGAGGTYQVAMALAGDIFRSGERSKALGLLEAANGLGKVISPILGAALMMLVWWAPFFAYPLIAWVSALLVWRVVEEPKGTATDRPLAGFVRGLGRVFHKKGRSLLTCFLAGAAPLFFLFGILSYYADVLEQRHHIEGVVRGLVIAIPVSVLALTSYLSGIFLARRLARLSKTVVLAGLGLIAAAFVGMFFFHQQIVLFTTSIAVMGMGSGLILPSLNTMITSATQSDERGTVTALYGTVRFFGAALGPPAFDKAVKTGAALPYLGSAALAAIVLAAAALWVDQRTMLAGLARSDQGRNAPAPRPAARTPHVRRSAPRDDRNRLT